MWPQLIGAGATVLGSVLRPSSAAPAGPSSADPFNTSIFDSSGWVVNFGTGARLDTSSSTRNTAPDVTGQGAGITGSLGLAPIGANDLLLLGGVLLAVWLWQR